VGQQQLLLIILGVIIVGVAISVGVLLFDAQSVEANKDAIISDLQNIAAYAYQYKLRPKFMAGGQGAYDGLKLSRRMATNENATYDVGTPSGITLTIVAVSAENTDDKVTVTINSDGKLGGYVFAGEFDPDN